MLKLADYYEIALLGEDIHALGCPEEWRKAIEMFRPFEECGFTEHKISVLSGLSLIYVRKLRAAYCKFNNLPVPVSIPGNMYHRTPTQKSIYNNSLNVYA